MAHKAFFENFYEKVFEALIEDNVGRCYDCLRDLFSDFEEALTYSNLSILIKFSSLLMEIMLPKIFLFVNVFKVLLLMLADGNSFMREAVIIQKLTNLLSKLMNCFLYDGLELKDVY